MSLEKSKRDLLDIVREHNPMDYDDICEDVHSILKAKEDYVRQFVPEGGDNDFKIDVSLTKTYVCIPRDINYSDKLWVIVNKFLFGHNLTVTAYPKGDLVCVEFKTPLGD